MSKPTSKDIATTMMMSIKTKRPKQRFISGIACLSATTYDSQEWIDAVKATSTMIDDEIERFDRQGKNIAKRKFVLALIHLGLDAHKKNR